MSELTKALPAAGKSHAAPLALEFAATAKRLFTELRAFMTESEESGDHNLVERGLNLKLLAQRAKHKIQATELADAHLDELAEQRREHFPEIERLTLEAEVRVLNRVVAGIHSAAGASVPQPLPEAPAAPAGPATAVRTAGAVKHRLSDVLPRWQSLKKPARSTVEVYEASVKRFEKYFPELYVETIEKRHIREFVAKLQAGGLSAKTIEKEHGVIRALLSIAEHDEWIDANPAVKILLPEVTGRPPVRSYTPAECAQIFASPVFVSGMRPVGCHGEAAFWVPLLLLYTGARREEICHLTTDKVRVAEGVNYLMIEPYGDDGHLKTEESIRLIPLHKQLLPIGFLEYVEERRAAGGGLLFPSLKPNARGQFGAKWGDWWGKYVREAGVIDERVAPAHSFRHLFITECRRLMFRPDYERALVGHTRGTGKKDAHDSYGEHLLPSLQSELNRIDFRGLDLSHLHR